MNTARYDKRLTNANNYRRNRRERRIQEVITNVTEDTNIIDANGTILDFVKNGHMTKTDQNTCNKLSECNFKLYFDTENNHSHLSPGLFISSVPRKMQCKCGSLTGDMCKGEECNLCSTVCRYRPVDTDTVEPIENSNYTIDTNTTDVENISVTNINNEFDIEGEEMSATESNKTDKTVINIHQPKSEGLSAVAQVIGAIAIGGFILAAAWYLKR